MVLSMSAAGVLWTFVLEPRRLRLTGHLVPEPAATVAAAALPVEGPIPVERALKLEGDMLRSLERMDADLAELRSEVERLRGLLVRSARRVE